MDAALFHPEDGRFVPRGLARGPWDPLALHGGPVAALVGRAIEALPAPTPMRWVRVTVELLRPVPLAPLDVAAEVVRPGRRVRLASATLSAEGTELCRATALAVRRLAEPIVAPEAPDPAPAGPEGVAPEPPPDSFGAETFARGAVEHRWVEGSWGPGPATVWMRLTRPLVPGEEPTGLQTVLALADFANGIAAAVPWETHVFMNADLTVYLERDPVGPWVGLRSRSRLDPAGSGVAESELYDARGRVGRGLQALYVDRREP
jgi:hypothetical protein